MERACKGFKQPRVSVRLYGQVRDLGIVHRAVRAIHALIQLEVRVHDRPELQLAVDGVPAVRAGKVNAFLLHGGGDPVHDMRALIQILQMAGTRDDRRAAARLIGEQPVGIEHTVIRFDKLIAAAHAHRDGQLLAAAEHGKARLLAKAHTLPVLGLEAVELHHRFIVEIAALHLVTRKPDEAGRVFRLIADRHKKVELILRRRSTADAQLQRLTVIDAHVGVEHAGIVHLHRIAAVVADRRRFHAAVAPTQELKPVGVVHFALTIKDGIHAAALLIELDDPMLPPQLRLSLRLREDIIGRRIRIVLVRVGHIIERHTVSRAVAILVRVTRHAGKLRGGKLITPAHAGGQKLRHVVLRRLKEDLCLAVQLRLVQLPLHLGDGDCGKGKQHNKDRHRQKNLR